MKKGLLICLILAVIVSAVIIGTVAFNNGKERLEFSLTWDCYGISSYDSKSGTLIKTNDATDPEDYRTTCFLSEDKLEYIGELIEELDITSYPDEYNPHNNTMVSEPSMNLILSVNTSGIKKTVRAEDIALVYYADNEKGQKFLDVCSEIKNILTDTDEWRALPDYEFYYH